MGNAVGPVALIAAGIYLGYITLAGKTSAFVALLKGTTPSTPPAPATGQSFNSMAASPTGGGWGAGLTPATGTSGGWGSTPWTSAATSTPQAQLIASQTPLTIEPIATVGS